MTSTTKYILAAIVLVLVIAGAYWYHQANTGNAGVPNGVNSTVPAPSGNP